jgi:multidrug resistance efflux pump
MQIAGRRVGFAIIVLALVFGLVVTRIAYREPRTDDALVRANIVGIAPHVSGPLTALNVVDNQEVHEGDLLFVVDPRPYEVDLEKARAAVMLAQSEVAATTKAIEAATADVARLEAERDYARDHVGLLDLLCPHTLITPAPAPERSLRGLDQLLKSTVLLKRDAIVVERSVSLDEIAAGHAPQLEFMQRASEADLEYRYVRAPFDAQVTNPQHRAGRVRARGQQVFALVDRRTWYVLPIPGDVPTRSVPAWTPTSTS